MHDYISRFNNEALQVNEHNDGAALIAVIASLQDEKLLNSIGENQPCTYVELVSRGQKYMSVKKLLKSKRS